MRLTPIVAEVLELQCRNHGLPNGHRITTETDTFTREPTLWIRQNAPAQLGSSFVVNPTLRSQSAPSSLLHMDPAASPTFTPLSQAKHSVQAPASVNMNTQPTARESESPLRRGTSCSFADPVPLSSFLNMRIPFRKHLQEMPNLHHVLGIL